MGAILGDVLSMIMAIVPVLIVIFFVGRMLLKWFYYFFGIGLLVAMYFGYQWYKDHKAEVDARVKKELSSKENQELLKKIKDMGQNIKEELKKQLEN